MRAPLVVLCIVASPGLAQEAVPAPAPGAPAAEIPLEVPAPAGTVPRHRDEEDGHRHVGGFFRMTLGGGYLSTTPSPSGAAAFSSGAASLSAAAGYAVAENWILAGDAWVSAAPAGKLGRDWTLGLTAFGLNITHYLMPANVYLSFVPSVTVVTVSDKNSEVVRETQAGFGARFSVGKEWWVADHWGIGIALEGFFASNHEQASAQPIWTTVGGSLVFTSTYN
ncbi:MAG: hypothetical protein ACXWLS_05910 [Myxococcaceae bacterium]